MTLLVVGALVIIIGQVQLSRPPCAICSKRHHPNGIPTPLLHSHRLAAVRLSKMRKPPSDQIVQ